MEKKSSRYAVVGLAVVGLLLAYPLSMGPAFGYLRLACPQSDTDIAIYEFYRPLLFCVPESGWKYLNGWVRLWERAAEAVKH